MNRLEKRLGYITREEMAHLRRRLTLAVLGGHICLALILSGLVVLAGVIAVFPWLPLSVLLNFLIVGSQGWRRPRQKELPPDASTTPLNDMSRSLCGEVGLRGSYVMVVSNSNSIRFATLKRSRLPLWSRNYVIIGLPILLSLTPDQFECHLLSCVLRHKEHKSAGLERAERLISFSNLLDRCYGQPKEGRRSPVMSLAAFYYRATFRPFLSWYMPRLTSGHQRLTQGASRLADDRLLEFCDDVAIEQTRTVLGRADSFLENDYWPTFVREICASSDLPTPHAQMEGALATELGDLLEPRAGNAARTLLGQQFGVMVQYWDSRWQEENSFDLEASRQRHKKTLATYEELKTLETTSGLASSEALKAARAAEQIEGAEAAIPLYERLIDDAEVGIEAQRCLGHLLLASGDEAGLGHLRQAAFGGDGESSFRAALEASAYLREEASELQAQPFAGRARELGQALHPMYEERSRVSGRDRFFSHGLDGQVIDQLKSELANGPKIRRAYLVRKTVTASPEKPAYVLGIMTQGSVVWRLDLRALGEARDFARRHVELPDSCLVVGLYHDAHTTIIRKMRRVRGARII